MPLSTLPVATEYLDMRLTKVPTRVFRASTEASRYVAQLIASVMRERAAEGRPCVLGLATGSTPVGVYRELIRMHREEGLDFSHVITFNLDEYYPMDPSRLQSYRNWMDRIFFNHVNIPRENTHVPDGSIPPDEVETYCERYEQMIQDAGGLDLQLLGIGRTGHIGFNEPGSTVDSRTRLVTLDPVTRKDAASDFFGEENVPLQGITMGVGTILSARKIVLMAFGEHKASIVRQAVEGPVTESIPASFLQTHPDAQFVLDEAAAAKLTEIDTPWLVGSVEWTPTLVKKAMIWLCMQVDKALLKLEDDDLRNHGLHELLREYGPAQRIAQDVFQQMMATVCYTPSGSDRRRIVVFSPHPDDDVISMGGTLLHLTRVGHDVHVAYMTSGNIAVFDHDVERYVDFVLRFLRVFEIPDKRAAELAREVRRFIARKKPGDVDSTEVREIKTLIREIEARAAAMHLGVPDENLHFLRLPFYETGAIEKNPVTEADIEIIETTMTPSTPAT